MTLDQNPQEPSVHPPLDVAAVRGRLRSAGRTGQIVYLQTCDSTNAQAAALKLGEVEAEDWALVVAEEQTAGRGRLSRTWSSPRGAGLLFSVAVAAPTAPPHLSLLPLLVGLAVAQQCQQHGVPAQVKWPNDIIVADSSGTVGKLGGVLLERTAHTVIAGVGLNVFASPHSQQAPEGTALVDQGLLAVEGVREVLLADCTVAILNVWYALQADEPAPLVAEYRHACTTLGRQVRATLPDGTHIVGEAVDIDETGRLLVVPDTGEGLTPASGVAALSAADIVHLRTV